MASKFWLNFFTTLLVQKGPWEIFAEILFLGFLILLLIAIVVWLIIIEIF